MVDLELEDLHGDNTDPVVFRIMFDLYRMTIDEYHEITHLWASIGAEDCGLDTMVGRFADGGLLGIWKSTIDGSLHWGTTSSLDLTGPIYTYTNKPYDDNNSIDCGIRELAKVVLSNSDKLANVGGF